MNTATMTEDRLKIGAVVVQYDYVEAREERGAVQEIGTRFNRATGDDDAYATVAWESGVTTEHPIDDFSCIAARTELRVV